MDSTIDTGGNSWSEWFQNIAGNVINKATDANYVRPYDVQALRLQQLGNGGYYTEGMLGARPGNGTGITPGVLLLAGAALVAVMLLKD